MTEIWLTALKGALEHRASYYSVLNTLYDE